MLLLWARCNRLACAIWCLEDGEAFSAAGHAGDTDDVARRRTAHTGDNPSCAPGYRSRADPIKSNGASSLRRSEVGS